MERQLGEELRALRKAMGLTIYDVERLTGVRFNLISAYERGQKKPSLSSARKLAKLFHVPVAQLILTPAEVAESVPEELRDVTELLLKRPELLKLVWQLADLPPDSIKGLTGFIAGIRSQSAAKTGE